MKNHQNLTTACNKPLSTIFNEVTAKAREVELKFLVPTLPNGPSGQGGHALDLQAFDKIVKYFDDRGLIKLRQHGKSLQSLQFDTVNRELFNNRRTTIRTRGETVDGTLNSIKEADVCVKIEDEGTAKDASDGAEGALKRGEHEVRINNFKYPNLPALLAEYSAEEHPDLHAALEGVKPEDLHCFFRIDCIRNRYLVDIPESITGLKDTRFVGELLMDNVVYHTTIDIGNGQTLDLVFHHDLEVECEALFKACSYDPNPASQSMVSSPMTEEQLNTGMAAVQNLLMNATHHMLTPNHKSKARRGFEGLDRELNRLRQIAEVKLSVDTNNQTSDANQGVRGAFVATACNEQDTDETLNKLHRFLSQNYGYLFKNNMRQLVLG